MAQSRVGLSPVQGWKRFRKLHVEAVVRKLGKPTVDFRNEQVVRISVLSRGQPVNPLFRHRDLTCSGRIHEIEDTLIARNIGCDTGGQARRGLVPIAVHHSEDIDAVLLPAFIGYRALRRAVSESYGRIRGGGGRITKPVTMPTLSVGNAFQYGICRACCEGRGRHPGENHLPPGSKIRARRTIRRREGHGLRLCVERYRPAPLPRISNARGLLRCLDAEGVFVPVSVDESEAIGRTHVQARMRVSGDWRFNKLPLVGINPPDEPLPRCAGIMTKEGARNERILRFQPGSIHGG
jgi:hypothetical protein